MTEIIGEDPRVPDDGEESAGLVGYDPEIHKGESESQPETFIVGQAAVVNVMQLPGWTRPTYPSPARLTHRGHANELGKPNTRGRIILRGYRGVKKSEGKK